MSTISLRMAKKAPRKTAKPATASLEIFGGAERRKTWNEDVIMLGTVPFVYPKWKDARYIQLAAHATYAFLGQLAYSFEVSKPQVAFIVLGCALLDVIFNYVLRRVLIFPASGLIGGLGLAMFLRIEPGAPSYLLYALAIVLTISSKYIFALKTEGGKNHIFNPSNFGIVTMLLLFPSLTLTRPDQWDPSLLLISLVMLLGITLVVRAKVAWLTFAFILAESVMYLIQRGGIGGLTAYSVFQGLKIFWLQTPTLLVFAFHMLSDPRTVPKTQLGRTLHAISTANLHWLLLAFGVGRSSVFIAPFMVCLFTAGIRVIGPRFRKETVPA